MFTRCQEKPSRYWLIGLFFLVSATYSCLFYFILSHQYKIDFSSLYSALELFNARFNPYQQTLFVNYLPNIKKLAANLNPPFVLWLFKPLNYLHYEDALLFWSCLSFLLGLIGAYFCFRLTFSKTFFKKNWFSLYLIYLTLFSTIATTALAQFGTILFFLIMTGYYCYLNKQDYLAGFLWGTVIAIKLFPALLFIFVLSEKRYKLFLLMLGFCLLLSLFPWLESGSLIYKQYFSLIASVSWYGDNWNASIYGFISRLFKNNLPTTNYLSIPIIYGGTFLLALGWYCKKLFQNLARPNSTYYTHQAFCLTLVMMLLLSPLGWLYYFNLLIFPLVWCEKNIASEKERNLALIWLICLFLINAPVDYVHIMNMPTFISKIGFYSLHFYGLLLLTYLIMQQPNAIIASLIDENSALNDKMITSLIPGICIILGFGLFIPIISFMMRLLKLPGISFLDLLS